MMVGARTAAWSGGKRLPYKRRLAWIGSNGGVYFDLGIKADFRSFRCKHQHSDKAETIFGSKYGSPWNAPSYWFNTSTWSEYIPGGTINVRDHKVDVVVTSDIVTRKNTFVSDFENITTSIEEGYSVNEDVKTLNIYLFARLREDDSVGSNNAIGKFYELEIFDGALDSNRLVYVYPVVDNNDVVCMYDEVSGKCLYNLGTGEPTYGELEVITT